MVSACPLEKLPLIGEKDYTSLFVRPDTEGLEDGRATVRPDRSKVYEGAIIGFP
jgi:hypothetical protein